MIEEIKKYKLLELKSELKNIKDEYDRLSAEFEKIYYKMLNLTKELRKYKKNIFLKIINKHRIKELQQSIDMCSKNIENIMTIKGQLSELIINQNKLIKTIDKAKSLSELNINSEVELDNYCKLHNIEISLDDKLNYCTSLRKNKEFMMEAIKKNIDCIKYDETNDLDVYRSYLNLVSKSEQVIGLSANNLLLKLNDSNFLNKLDFKFLNYLFESIKKNFIPDDIEKIKELYDSNLGIELRSLYERDDIVLGLHGCNIKNDINGNNVIFQNGLKSSSQTGATNQLDRTVAYGDNISLLEMFSYNAANFGGGLSAYNYIITIPKEAFDKENPLPIWGTNTPGNGENYLLPDYVYGYYVCYFDKISPIIRNQCVNKTSYNYAYVNGNTNNPIDINSTMEKSK